MRYPVFLFLICACSAFSQTPFASTDFSISYNNRIIGSYVLPNGHIRCFWVPSAPKYGFNSDTAILTDFNQSGTIVRQISLGVRALAKASSILPLADGSAILQTRRQHCDLIRFNSISRVDTAGTFRWLCNETTHPAIRCFHSYIGQFDKTWLHVEKHKVHLETGTVEDMPGWPPLRTPYVYDQKFFYFCQRDTIFKYRKDTDALVQAKKVSGFTYQLLGPISGGNLVLIHYDDFEILDTSDLNLSYFGDLNNEMEKRLCTMASDGSCHLQTKNGILSLGPSTGFMHEFNKGQGFDNVQAQVIKDSMYIFYEQQYPGFEAPTQIGLMAYPYYTDTMYFYSDVALTDLKLVDGMTSTPTPHPSPFEPPGKAVDFGRLKATIQNNGTDTIKTITLSYLNFGCPTFCPYASYYNERFDQLSIAPGTSTELTTQKVSVSCTESDISKVCLWVTKPNDKPDKNPANNQFCAETSVNSQEAQTIGSPRFSIQIVPNPSTGIVTIFGNGQQLSIDAIQISNTLGQLVYHQNGIRLPLEVNLSNFNPGFYSVKLSKGPHYALSSMVIVR